MSPPPLSESRTYTVSQPRSEFRCPGDRSQASSARYLIGDMPRSSPVQENDISCGQNPSTGAASQLVANSTCPNESPRIHPSRWHGDENARISSSLVLRLGRNGRGKLCSDVCGAVQEEESRLVHSILLDAAHYSYMQNIHNPRRRFWAPRLASRKPW